MGGGVRWRRRRRNKGRGGVFRKIEGRGKKEEGSGKIRRRSKDLVNGGKSKVDQQASLVRIDGRDEDVNF